MQDKIIEFPDIVQIIIPPNINKFVYCPIPYLIKNKNGINCWPATFLMASIYLAIGEENNGTPIIETFNPSVPPKIWTKLWRDIEVDYNEIEKNQNLRLSYLINKFPIYGFVVRDYLNQDIQNIKKMLEEYNIPVIIDVNKSKLYPSESMIITHAIIIIGFNEIDQIFLYLDPDMNNQRPLMIFEPELTNAWLDERSFYIIVPKHKARVEHKTKKEDLKDMSLDDFLKGDNTISNIDYTVFGGETKNE